MNRLHAILASLALASSALSLRAAAPVQAPPARYRAVLPVDTEPFAQELLEPDRIRAVGGWYFADQMMGFHLAGYPHVAELSDLEAVLRLRPDLVVVPAWNDAGVRATTARLRELSVQTLAMPRGADAVAIEESLRVFGRMTGEPARGEAAAAAWERAYDAVRAWPAPAAPKPRGLFAVAGVTYLSIGGSGNELTDLIAGAGIDDVAARAGFTGWSDVGVETVLALHPELIVTRDGRQADALYQHPALLALPAMRRPGGVIGFPHHYLSNAGTDLLDAIESLSAQIWGEPSAR